MDIRKLQRVIVDGLEDVKAQSISVFNTEHLSALFERVIIASGTSNRQTKSLASSVREAVKKAGYPVPRTEGERNGEWIIIDCGAAVVHVMQPTIREYYPLEEIWGDKPVNMKIAVGNVKLVKAAEPEPIARKSAAKKLAAKKLAAKKPAARTAKGVAEAPAKKVAAKKLSAARAPAKKAPSQTATKPRTLVVGKPPAKKVATASRGVTRTVGVKSPAAKRAPAAKKAVRGVTRTVGVKSPAAKTTPAAKKSVARKAPPRRA